MTRAAGHPARTHAACCAGVVGASPARPLLTVARGPRRDGTPLDPIGARP